MALHRSFRVDVGNVDDAAAACRQRRGGRLREKQRRLQVHAEQIIPLRFAYFVQRRCIKRRRIVDQHVKPAKMRHAGLDQARQLRRVVEVELECARGVFSAVVELTYQRLGVRPRGTIMQRDLETLGVQAAANFRADAARASGNQGNFAVFISHIFDSSLCTMRSIAGSSAKSKHIRSQIQEIIVAGSCAINELALHNSGFFKY